MMKRNELSLFILALVLISVLAACSPGGKDRNADPDNGGDTSVFLCLSTGGLGDNGFNDNAYLGMQNAESELGITWDYAEPTSYSECEEYVMEAASSGEYDLIIAIGYDNFSAVDRASDAYPDQKFAILQAGIDKDNVLSVKEKLNEQGYLLGTYAAEMMIGDRLEGIEGKRSIGIIVGVDSDEFHSKVYGFQAAVKDVAGDDITVEVVEVGAWNDPATAKELAVSLYEKGCGIIYHCAGSSGLGLFEAAKEIDDLYVIGASGNQNDLGDRVLCSSVDRMDSQVKTVIEDFVEGRFEAGTMYLGFGEEAMKQEYEGSRVEYPDDVKAIVDETEQKLISGEIDVPYTGEEYEAYIAK